MPCCVASLRALFDKAFCAATANECDTDCRDDRPVFLQIRVFDNRPPQVTRPVQPSVTQLIRHLRQRHVCVRSGY